MTPRTTYGQIDASQQMEKSSLALSQIFDPIRADLAQVDAEFGRHIESQIDLIPKIGKYIQTSGGKRMRPAVLLMSARLSGYTGDRAILYAAVVEFIHTATLVHDDIIDDADLRRAGWRFIRAGATTSRCFSAITSTSSRWRWRSRTTRWTSCGCSAK